MEGALEPFHNTIRDRVTAGITLPESSLYFAFFWKKNDINSLPWFVI
jgi:hypothetical protein